MRHFFLIELAVNVQGWWTAPVQVAEQELDELAWIGRFWRLAAAMFCLESLLGLALFDFLRLHGQL